MKTKNSRLLFSASASSLLFIPGLLLGLSCVVATWHYKKQVYLQYRSVEQRFQTSVNHYLAVNTEALLVEKYYPAVRMLHDRGVIGQEHRLDWIEALQRSAKRLGLPNLNYRIGIQTILRIEVLTSTSRFRIYYSPMQFNAVLFHEGDLQALFHELESDNHGIFRISSCRLNRLHREITTDLQHGNIRTECELLWFNIRHQDGGIIEFS